MDLDDTLIALADDTRRSILKRLASGDARVTEVAAPFEISLNSVSKHIRILERAGLVRRRVAGRDHFLSLERAPFESATRTKCAPRQSASSPSMRTCFGCSDATGSELCAAPLAVHASQQKQTDNPRSQPTCSSTARECTRSPEPVNGVQAQGPRPQVDDAC